MAESSGAPPAIGRTPPETRKRGRARGRAVHCRRMGVARGLAGPRGRRPVRGVGTGAAPATFSVPCPSATGDGAGRSVLCPASAQGAVAHVVDGDGRVV